MPRFKVALIANDIHPVPDWVYEKFRKEDIDFVFHNCHSREELEKYASDADVIFISSARGGLVIEENMDIFKKAVCVIKGGSGTDNIDRKACTEKGIIIAHTPEDPTEPASDHFIAMLFSAVRQIANQDRLVRKGIWDSKAAMPFGLLTGADVGIIGFGRIGRKIIEKLSGFKMNIRVFDPNVSNEDILQVGAKKVSMEKLLKRSRYVMVACPLLEETHNLIGEKQLKMMRKDAILVNVARAGIVDEDSLKHALREKWISAAAIDVLGEHPLKEGNEWLEFENVTFSPHIAGYSGDYPDEIFRTPVEVILDIARGKMPPWIVNRECKASDFIA